MDSKISSILAHIEGNAQQYKSVASKIWDYSELSFQEEKSADELKKVLCDNGFQHRDCLSGIPTAFMVEAGAGRPIIAFLGEYDALPNLSQYADCPVRKPIQEGGAGHGCGHHILGTAAMAAAIAARDYIRDHNQEGTIRFYGCPAEEGGGGKIHMANQGVFDDVDCAITWHPADDNNIWSMNFMATQRITVVFSGVSAHAPSQVHIGKSALSAAELMNIGINFLRGQVLRDVSINYAFVDAGGVAPNVIPDHTEVVYLIRAHTQDHVMTAARRVAEIAQGAAMMIGCTADVQYGGGVSELIPNRTLERLAYDQFLKVGPTPYTKEDVEFCKEIRKSFPENAEEGTFSALEYLYESSAKELIRQIKGKPINDILYPYQEIKHAKFGSTDVCDVSWITPVVQLTTACYAKDTPGHSWQQVAQGKRPLCLNGMLTAAKVMALTAVELVSQPETMQQIRDEFAVAMEGKVYQNPIPSHKLKY